MKDTFDELGVNYYYSEVDGAHDLGCWRESLTIFAKDCLWDPVVEEIPPVEVPENNPNIEENAPVTPPETNQAENVSTSIDEKKTAIKTGNETPIISFAALTIICLGVMVVLKRQQIKS